jgi:hypothetical protein
MASSKTGPYELAVGDQHWNLKDEVEIKCESYVREVSKPQGYQ